MSRRSDAEGESRLEYLQKLITEYEDSGSADYKEQVMANLANFAYDPGNHEWLLQLNVPDLFLDAVAEEREPRMEFAVGGLCNLAMNPTARATIIDKDGVSVLMLCLSSSNEETVLSGLATLLLLARPGFRRGAGSCLSVPGAAVQGAVRLARADSSRVRNLATIFLQDCCTTEQVTEAEKSESGSVVGIPLPPATP
uniref:armadillo repeat-containing protein 7 n=1 Tax=Myxine glutinosa TaxID=7769 RepID=UPI00358F8CCB